MNQYKKTVLDNGLRLVTEYIPTASSVALGIWAAAGSRDETEGENGVAHLIEHMVFKGTAGRDTASIAKLIDRLGGQANAYTTRELTCFHNRVRPGDLEEAVDLLWDMLQNSLFDEEELEREKQVIIQEIAMSLDEPEELAHELKAGFVWPANSLGRPVAGTTESVSGLDFASIKTYMSRHYNAKRMVFSAAGKLDHDQLADIITKKMGPLSQRNKARAFKPAVQQSGFKLRKKKLEQLHLVMGCPFPAAGDERRYAASVLNLLLGGNMSSRLFQEIRERLGLTYSVYSYYTPLSDTGVVDIYAAVAPDKISEAVEAVRLELKRLKNQPLDSSELLEAVEALKTGIILSGESCEARMSRLGRNELFFGRNLNIEDVCRRIDAVSPRGIYELANEFFQSSKIAVCLLGPLKDAELNNIKDNFYEAGI